MKAIDRLYEFLAEKSLKPTTIEKEIGLSNGYLSAQKKRNADMGEGVMLKIIDYFRDINPLWLLTGEGPMLIDNNKPLLSTISSNDEDTTIIPMVDISVAAGCSGYDNPNYIEVVDSIKMPVSMIKCNSKYFCIRVKGESMSPTILDSSYVIVRLLERQDWVDIPEQHVYVISDREGRAYIKRIKNRLREQGFIVCMSDNPDKANYPNFNLQENEINTILHAEWYISAKMPNIHETYYKKVSEMEDSIDFLQNQMNQVLKIINTRK